MPPFRTPRLARSLGPAAALAATVALAACGTAAPAGPSGTAPTPPVPSAEASPAASAQASSAVAASSSPTPSPAGSAAMPTAPFTLSSSAFAAGSPIPRAYTCDGANVSPPLSWSGAPDGTGAFLLIVDDPDANGFIHWVVADLGGTTGSFAQGASGHLEPAVEGRNGFGRVGWGGPCPPSGTHHYRFTLTALSAPLGLRSGMTAAQARAAVQGKALGQTVLTGTYHR